MNAFSKLSERGLKMNISEMKATKVRNDSLLKITIQFDSNKRVLNTV